MSGIVTRIDTSLQVIHAGVLHTFSSQGVLLWQINLMAFRQNTLEPFWHSLPTALPTGATLVVLPHMLLDISFDGQNARVFESSTRLDDSRLSPNVTIDGHPLVASPFGTIHMVKNGVWQQIGATAYGYDLLTPAIYDDGSLAIPGYAVAGFCRVSLQGTMLWQTSFRNADMIPSINTYQVSAVGSINDDVSALFWPDGNQRGEYGRAAIFAEYRDGGWIALSWTDVARLDPDGRVLWEEALPAPIGHRRVQPIVDSEGRIYVRILGGLLCFDDAGQRIFEVKIPGDKPNPPSIVAPGTMAYVAHDRLVLIT